MPDSSKWFLWLYLAFTASLGYADEPKSCLLRYKLSAGEEIRFDVSHMVHTTTKVSNSEESADTETSSTSVWRITKVDPDGNIFIEHLVEKVRLTQQHNEEQPLQWDSTSGEKPPETFGDIDKSIGKTVAIIKINPQGEELERTNDQGTKTDLGMGTLTLPMPKETIQVGHRWFVPRQIRVRDDVGKIKIIKFRERYILEKLAAGVATLSVETQTLTPIAGNPLIERQVIQQLSKGTIKFDVDAGRPISKQLDWNETIIGFSGPGTTTKYNARITEKRVDTDPTTRTATRKTDN